MQSPTVPVAAARIPESKKERVQYYDSFFISLSFVCIQYIPSRALTVPVDWRHMLSTCRCKVDVQ